MTRIPIGRIARTAALGAIGIAALSSACLDRPVAPATPSVTARVNEKAKQSKVSKIDLLFMIDNSSSMADKQGILAEAVPDLVDRLVNPVCVFADGTVSGKPDGNDKCPDNTVKDFEPVKDIHIGVISSSIGGHGSKACKPTEAGRQNVDMHLLTRNTGRRHGRAPPGTRAFSPGTATAIPPNAFTDIVKGVGQHGCGYEASLESIYHFLIDPEPYTEVSTTDHTVKGPDDALLQQRKDFLRPDSLVAVIAVTDENDCSVIDGGSSNYLVVEPGSKTSSVLCPGTAICQTDPNNACCYNCCIKRCAGRLRRPPRSRGMPRRCRLHGGRGSDQPPLLQQQAALRIRLPLPGRALHRRLYPGEDSSQPLPRRQYRESSKDNPLFVPDCGGGADAARRATLRWCSLPESSASLGRTSPGTPATSRKGYDSAEIDAKELGIYLGRSGCEPARPRR